MKILVLMLLSSSFVYPFAYDSAIAKAQKGNWQDAHSTLSGMITDNPDRADVIYDAGVAAYNLGNKCHAATCFARAAECSSDKNITFCAHFNAGNVYVDEKKLERALEEYDKALAIEPENEYARHNRDRVAQMLNEQQQNKDQSQDQHNKDDEQNQDDNPSSAKATEDRQDKQQNQDNKQDQNQNGNDQQSSSGDDSSSAQASADRQKDGQQNQAGQNDNEKQDQKNNSSQNESSQDESLNQQSQGDGEQQAETAKQRAEHGNNPKDEHHNSGDDKKRNGNDKFDKKAQDAQKEGHEQQRDKHNTTPEKQHESNDKSNASVQDGQEDAHEKDGLGQIALNDPWLLKILDNQEMHDKAVNKQLMEAKIRQHGGKNGQNCW